jgi:hypothetical protein
METFKSVIMHTIELLIVVALAWFVQQFLPDLYTVELRTLALAAILGSLAKLSRTSPRVPLPDFVNGSK